ncbi:phage tail protein [Arthrobacter sp. OY3WO11]|uniref:phage tail protein n=1 Tax=Arthrobacter sp. OY3WO11 TaxID=1835723 RepID=UPI0007CF2327|nr:phage tail protein [Arthrobacter sp. OY3WO11]OAE01855.1 hypothetical protein A6A22_10835 [Arthrobacter sp. OY3WO11]
MASKYHFELWTPDGELIADFAGRAKNRRLTLQRNEAEDIIWQIDLAELERYARLMNTTPQSLLQPGWTEVRVRRGSTYLCGGIVMLREVRLSPTEQDVEVRAQGFLNLFAHRHVLMGALNEEEFTGYGNQIAADLITFVQNHGWGVGGPYDFGVTIGSLPALSVSRIRNYSPQVVVKEAIQNLTKLESGTFDFEFTADKVFNTYETMGSRRDDIVFTYPGNIKRLSSPLDAQNLANAVSYYGAGSGDAAVKATYIRSDSLGNYKAWEKIITDSSISEEDTLLEHAIAYADTWAWPFEIPAIEVDGNVAPFITDYGIGDYIRVDLSAHEILSHVNGYFRIEKIELAIDENDNESVKLSLSQ